MVAPSGYTSAAGDALVSHVLPSPSPDPYQKQLRWVHIPKCGQSFAITFYKYACPSCADNFTEYLTGSDSPTKVLEAQRKWQTNKCCDSSRLFEGGRAPMGHVPARPTDRGHLVTMLRDPKQRMISHYEYFSKKDKSTGEPVQNISEWLKDQDNYALQTRMLGGACPGNSGGGAASEVDLLASAEQTIGCSSHDSCGDPNATIDCVVNLVQDPEAMPFVGLLEYWDASIALFHAIMYGDDSIDPEELENIHPTVPSLHEVPDGMSDPIDQQLYDAAFARFHKETQMHAANARRLRQLRATQPSM